MFSKFSYCLAPANKENTGPVYAAAHKGHALDVVTVSSVSEAVGIVQPKESKTDHSSVVVLSAEMLEHKKYNILAAIAEFEKMGLVVNEKVKQELEDIYSVYPDWHQCAIVDVLANLDCRKYYTPQELYSSLVSPFLQHDQYQIANINSMIGVLVELRGMNLPIKSEKVFNDLLFSHAYFLLHAMHFIQENISDNIFNSSLFLVSNQNVIWNKFFEFVSKDPDHCGMLAKRIVSEVNRGGVSQLSAMQQPVFACRVNLKENFKMLSGLKSDFILGLDLKLCEIEERLAKNTKQPRYFWGARDTLFKGESLLLSSDLYMHALVVRLKLAADKAGSIAQLRLIKQKYSQISELAHIKNASERDHSREACLSAQIDRVMQAGSLCELYSIKTAFELESHAGFKLPR